jgi:hypothetical protein
MNFVIRHLFAHFLAFQEDKFERPEFFPGRDRGWLGNALVQNPSTYFISTERFLETKKTTIRCSLVYSRVGPKNLFIACLRNFMGTQLCSILLTNGLGNLVPLDMILVG